MDESNADVKINGTQSEVKQNCVENSTANSLPASSDSCVAKKTSFEITSITEPNVDDNDEDSPDTDPELGTDVKQEVDLQNYADSMVVYNTTNDLGSSAPVIPTSSQYGLAIVDNSESGLSVGNIKVEDSQLTDASSQKSECDLNGVQNKNRNERFKVVKIESTEPFKRGRWVCMDFLDHSMNQQQQPGTTSKLVMVNGDNMIYSQANDLDTTEPQLDNGHLECSEFKACTNNVSTYTSNCNTTDNYKNQTSTYNMVSSGVTTPIHSACVSPGQSLQSNMQVPVQTSQPVVVTSVQASQPQSLTQVQLPAQHINQNCLPPHSSLQSHQLQQVIANAGVMQPQLQQTQPVINVMQNQNPPIQPQSIQRLNSVEQHVTQTMSQQYQQPMSQANLQQQQIMQHNMPAQFQKSFVPQNQSALPNCPLQQPVNQIVNQQVPQYYNSPPVQTQNVTSESSNTVPMSNQHINQQQFQSIPIQNHVQLQQNQQQLPPSVQQMQQQPSSQQNMVQQNQMQPQMVQQNQQLSHQPSISQPNQPHQTQSVPQQHIQQPQQTPQTHIQQVPAQQQQQTPQQMQQVNQQIQAPQGSQIQQQLPSQQSHHISQLTQMTSQPQQISKSNQMQQIAQQQSQQISQQPQQIPLQTQQIPQQTQIQPQQINQQQIPQQQHMGQIAGQNQMVHQNNQQITHAVQMISQQNHNQGQQLNQQNQQVQQQQQQQPQQNPQQLQQPSQTMSQQILQPNQNIPQQNQVIPQQIGINQSISQMPVPQSQNQQVIQSQQPQHNMQQPGQQYQQPPQQMMTPQQLPMQSNQPIMHQPAYSQAQSLNAMQLQQVQMSSIPTNTVTSTQMHIQQQQQPVVQSNMMQPSQINVMSQNNVQPTIPMSQQQMTYSLQQHVPINPNYVNSMQNCYIPSQQQIPSYKPSTKTVETFNKKKEDNNSEDTDNGTTNSSGTTVAIDNKIEQAMDLVKSHLMYAVREEVEVLKEKIAELMDKVGLLETENSNLRMLVPPDILEQYNREKQKPSNGQSSHNQ